MATYYRHNYEAAYNKTNAPYRYELLRDGEHIGFFNESYRFDNLNDPESEGHKDALRWAFETYNNMER